MILEWYTSTRYWPPLVLIACSAPILILLRGWQGARALFFTIAAMPFWIVVFVLGVVVIGVVHGSGDSPEKELWKDTLIALIWPVKLFQAEPLFLIWSSAIAGLAFLRALATIAPADFAGRFLLFPRTGREGWPELFLQWALIAAGLYVLHARPDAVRALPLPVDLTEFAIAITINAGAYVPLTLAIRANRGAYPGFDGLSDAAEPTREQRWRSFRLVSRLRPKGARGEGLRSVFSRRDPALKRIIDGE